MASGFAGTADNPSRDPRETRERAQDTIQNVREMDTPNAPSADGVSQTTASDTVSLRRVSGTNASPTAATDQPLIKRHAYSARSPVARYKPATLRLVWKSAPSRVW